MNEDGPTHPTRDETLRALYTEYECVSREAQAAMNRLMSSLGAGLTLAGLGLATGVEKQQPNLIMVATLTLQAAFLWALTDAITVALLGGYRRAVEAMLAHLVPNAAFAWQSEIVPWLLQRNAAFLYQWVLIVLALAFVTFFACLAMGQMGAWGQVQATAAASFVTVPIGLLGLIRFSRANDFAFMRASEAARRSAR